MTFGKKILQFYKRLEIPYYPKDQFEIMVPFDNREVRDICSRFYEKYYNDNRERIFLIGINPGRFGAGITGLPFIDPINLEKSLGITNSFKKKHELSSQFIFSVIRGAGGADNFFSRFYLTAVSPIGFIRTGKNINYYELEFIRNKWKPFFIKCLESQVGAGGNREKAFILGQGENNTYFKKLNDEYGFFSELVSLPHPRWVMQYRFRQKSYFANKYIKKLTA
ncbi:MAG TPA: uracil-DNA glycosylase family protein [Cyclobacteriaceae bacterium]|nr:uracil-DNA glycosylase family protein [Cyclobacteriaceae bacterium]